MNDFTDPCIRQGAELINGRMRFHIRLEVSGNDVTLGRLGGWSIFISRFASTSCRERAGSFFFPQSA
jgi:hypothetical protein